MNWNPLRTIEAYFLDKPKTMLLCADVQEGKHNQLKPSQLQESRVEYHPFNKRKFKHHIYQEARHQKFINYLDQRGSQFKA
jgi:hypothetical protein